MKKIMQAVLLLLIAMLIGCDPDQYVIWSPDGSKAAVIGTDGLHLCDADGKLTPLLVKDVRKAAWFGDSTRLVAAREVKVANWTEASKFLEAERLRRIETEGEKLFNEMMAETRPLDQWAESLLDSATGPDAGDFVAMVLYMGEKHAEDLKKKITEEEWKKLREGDGVSVTVLHLYEVIGSEIREGPMLASTFSKVTGLRPSPGGKVLAYMTGDGGPRSMCHLFVVPADGGAQPKRVADLCARFADWSFDGKYLAYARANPPRARAEDTLRLGTLRRMQVCEADGTLKPQVPVDEVKHEKQADGSITTTPSPAESLAGIIWDEWTKVRCLRDGRIIFVSAEMNLPVASDDVPTRLSLFAIDPARQSTVSRVLSRKAETDAADLVQLFEISPDQTLVAIPGQDGRITVAPLAGGAVTVVQAPAEDGKFRMVPSWRSSDELCYAVSRKVQEQKGRAADVYLWRYGQAPRLISQEWTDEVMAIFERK